MQQRAIVIYTFCIVAQPARYVKMLPRNRNKTETIYGERRVENRFCRGAPGAVMPAGVSKNAGR